MSELCEHCGYELRGLAMVGDALVCHPVDPYPDCYRLVTVYGETLGSRNVARLRAAMQDLADHGLRADLTPTIDGSADVYAQMTSYLRRLDSSIREHARRALAPAAAEPTDTEETKETT